MMTKEERALEIIERLKKEYPDVPYFIYGHGMGSLIVRMDCIH